MRLESMRRKLINFYFILFAFLLLLSCSDPKLESPFDPESSFNTVPMQGELALNQLTDSEVKLQWQLNNTIVGNYIIKRQINSGGYEILTTVDKNSNSYNDTGLLTTNTYQYQVIGANGDVLTEPLSNSISTSFAEITDFNITQENLCTAKLTWQHNCSYEEGYIIERQEISSRENPLFERGGSDVDGVCKKITRNIENRGISNSDKNTNNSIKTSRDFIQIADLSANSFEYIDDTVLLNQTYEYRIHSYTTLNESSTKQSLILMEFPAPTNLTYDQLMITSIELNWDDNSNGEDGFKIDKKVGTNTWQIEYATVVEDITTWTDTNAEINEDLQYRVYGYSGSNQSTSLETGVIDNTIPAPGNLTYTLENISYPTADIHLSWDYSISGIEGFKVKKNGTLLTEIIPAETTEWIDVGANIENSNTYQVMAFFQNNNSAYSNEVTVDAINCMDIDGNIYETVIIGDQEWMAENLKVTHYNDGTPIPNVTDASEWFGLYHTHTGAYCYYDNSSSNGDTYGALYNWYAVNDARGLAPEGWHIPTDDEIKTLEMELGMSQSEADDVGFRGTNEGSKLAGNAALWLDGDLENDPDFGSSGFDFLPGGYRHYNGYYEVVGYSGSFWSATESDFYAWKRHLSYGSTQVDRSFNNKNSGFSVRCVRSVE